MKVLWFGMGGQSYLADSLRRQIEKNGFKLITIHEYPNADIKWSVNNVKKALNECDIVILPTDPAQPYKSSNRVIQAMAYGKVVLTDENMPSYNSIIKFKENGIIYDSSSNDYIKWINWLKENPKEKKQIEENAKKTAKQFSINKIGQKYINLFDESQKDIVDIIIPYYKNFKYLKKCLNSIRNNTFYPYNITIVNSSNDNLDCFKSLGDIINTNERKSFAQAVNIGIKSTYNKYFIIANDDILVSKYWLTNMMRTIKQVPRLAILNPLSNCDIGFQHNINLGKFVPNMALDQVSIEDINNFDRKNIQEYKERDWVAFYCTLIVRSAANEIGLLDENYINEFEDKDYCIRTQKFNYKIGTEYSSFVFHYGGKTRKISENLNQEKHKSESDFSLNYGIKKYEKPLFVIFTGIDNQYWDERSLEEGGIGGSETNTINLAREMSKLNYNVKIFNNCKINHFDYKYPNVEYINHEEFRNWIEFNYIDCFLSSRWSYPFSYPIRSKINLLLAHDVFIKGDNVFQDKVHYYLALSNEHKNFLSNHHNIPKEKILITANGIDLSRFDQKVIKSKNRMIYSSSLDRGFDVLALDIFPKIKEKYPDMELHVFYGIEGWDEAIKWKKQNNKLYQWEIDLYERVKKGLNIPGIIYHGKIDQKQLAKEFLQSFYWGYPTHFEETYCITALEAMAAGCHILTSDYWGLKDTVKDAGILIPYKDEIRFYNRTKEYIDNFINNTFKLISGEINNTKIGFKRVSKFQWSNIAQQFDRFIKNNDWIQIQD